MTAKEYFQQFFVLQCSINITIEQIERLHSIAIQTTTVLKGVVSGSASGSSRVEKAVVNIQGLIDRLADDLARMIDMRAKVVDTISRVKNPQERTLLKFRYLCLYSWNEISKIMLFSPQRIFQLHQQALKKIQIC